MGALKLSSRTACCLLWLFVAHSLQVCVLAAPATRSEEAVSDGSEKNVTVLDRPDAHNAAPADAAHASGSKEQPAESGGNGEPSKSVPPQPAPTARSKTKEESNVVPSPVSIGAQVGSSQGQLNQVESVGDKRGGGKLVQNARTPSELLTKQPAIAPENGQAGEQQESGDRRPASSAVDLGKQNADVSYTKKRLEAEKTSVKKSSEGSTATAGVSLGVSTSEATTLAREKPLATTTLKPAELAHPVSSEHAKLLPGALSQGQGVAKKYSDALPDVTKDLGGMLSASSGNIEYGHLKEPDSGEDLEPPLPTKKNPTFAVSSSAQLGVQPVVGSIGGSRPEKPLDASAAAGSMPLLSAQDDSHFFAYFLTAVVLCVVGYLVFHNKRKILALILEGRHERQRRHNGHYRRLDNVDDAAAVRKGRGSF